MGWKLKKKKYTCCLCSNLDKTENRISFCRECKVVREYIRKNGIDCILNIIYKKNNGILMVQPTNPPSCPPYLK